MFFEVDFVFRVCYTYQMHNSEAKQHSNNQTAITIYPEQLGEWKNLLNSGHEGFKSSFMDCTLSTRAPVNLSD